MAAVAVVAALLLSLTPVGTASAVQSPQDRVVSDDPANWTPHVLNGSVRAFVQVGDRIVVGGAFSEVQEAGAGKPVLARQNIFAFDATTGAIDPSFAPTADGQVAALLAAPDSASVYVGGHFSQINGVNSRRLARLQLSNGQPVPGFNVPAFNGIVKDLRMIGSQLVLAGSFSRVGGQDRTALASLDSATGAVTPFMNLPFESTRDGARQVIKMDVSPDGSRLVGVGNFTAVSGQPRVQIVMLDTSGSVATLAAWQTNFYATNCNPIFDTYMRDLDFSPDGAYFIVSTTGAYGGSEGPCDVITRWETSTTGSGLLPTWRNYTGGDTTYAVAVTGTAIYIGGHMRWVNNPFAGDAAGPGAIPREGIAALDPGNGMPFSWDPGRARGVGVFDLLATPTGLWVGSDTDRIGGEIHRKLAFFPLDGGTDPPPNLVGTLPNDVYLLGRPPIADPTVLYRVNAGGPALASVDDGPDWQAGTSSPYVNTGNNASWTPVPTVNASVPDSDTDRAPRALFDSERWDSGTPPEMQWTFLVPAGTKVRVRLYLANRCGCTSAVGSRVFDIDIDGTNVLDNLDLVAQYGDQVGAMESFDTVSDGSVEILLRHVVENPLINGIELIDLDVPPGGGDGGVLDVQRHQFFTGSDAPEPTVEEPGADPWRLARGAMLVDGTLYTGWADGRLYIRSFDGTTFGPRSAVELFGNSFTSDLANVTGMTYADGRVFYTLFGDNRLFWRAFLPESRSVGAARFAAGGDVAALDPTRVAGMFVSGSRLYFADQQDGDLYSVGLTGAAVSGPAVAADATIDWRSRGAFVWNGTPTGGPNLPPTAAFDISCAGLTCTADGSASSDPDGTITEYEWSFGDGSPPGTGSQVVHAYDTDGTYDVTLTVTDNDGAAVGTTEAVTVETPPPSSIDFRAAASSSLNVVSPSVAIPAAVQEGDALLLFVTTNTLAAWTSEPAGWSLVGEQTSPASPQIRTRLYSRVAAAGDAGQQVVVGLESRSKTDMTVLAYTGLSAAPVVAWASAGETVNRIDHRAPDITVPEPGSWVVSYFADKSSDTSSWDVPGATERIETIGAGSGRITSVATDSAGAVPVGTWTGLTAVASATSARATMWTVVLA
ncbi:MAG: PKD domain-containing protein [Acidimicrobiales bacterium]